VGIAAIVFQSVHSIHDWYGMLQGGFFQPCKIWVKLSSPSYRCSNNAWPLRPSSAPRFGKWDFIGALLYGSLLSTLLSTTLLALTAHSTYEANSGQASCGFVHRRMRRDVLEVFALAFGYKLVPQLFPLVDAAVPDRIRCSIFLLALVPVPISSKPLARVLR